jgi:uncharacterized protein
LKAGANIEAADEMFGYTALHLAAEMGSTDAIRSLLAEKANVKVKSWTGGELEPLQLAAIEGHRDAFALLWDARAKIGPQTPEFAHSLMITAIWNDKPTIVRELLKLGQSPDQLNEWGGTLLHYAAERNRTRAAEILLDGKAKIESIDNDKRTPLFVAVEEGHLEMVRLLLARKANPKCRNDSDESAISKAVEKRRLDLAILLWLSGATR